MAKNIEFNPRGKLDTSQIRDIRHVPKKKKGHVYKEDIIEARRRKKRLAQRERKEMPRGGKKPEFHEFNRGGSRPTASTTSSSRPSSFSRPSFGSTGMGAIPQTGARTSQQRRRKEYDEDEFKNYGQFRSKQVRDRNAARKLARRNRLAAMKAKKV